MKPSEMTNEELANRIENPLMLTAKDYGDCCREAADRLRRPTPVDDDLLKMARDIDKLRAKLKVAEDALEAASDAFRFCIEQCELELGPRMIGKLCDDGKAVERALAAIREQVTDCNQPKGENDGK